MSDDRIDRKHQHPDDVRPSDDELKKICRMYLKGAEMPPEVLSHICQRLLDLLKPKPSRGRKRTKYQIAGGWVEHLIIKKGMPMMEARALVADMTEVPRDKVGQAHRDYRPKKK
ncbi:hypothetical protein [Rhizobium giardinii]|uniref:hypothetical protein n=1 Tax=Rhizobium giardinii TaxID=56731 RepID=UPI003D6F7DD1